MKFIIFLHLFILMKSSSAQTYFKDIGDFEACISLNVSDFETKMLENKYVLKNKLTEDEATTYTFVVGSMDTQEGRRIDLVTTSDKRMVMFSTYDPNLYLSIKNSLPFYDYKFHSESEVDDEFKLVYRKNNSTPPYVVNLVTQHIENLLGGDKGNLYTILLLKL